MSTTTIRTRSQYNNKVTTHAAKTFVPRDLELWPSDFKINGFPGLVEEHLCVKWLNVWWS